MKKILIILGILLLASSAFAINEHAQMHGAHHNQTNGTLGLEDAINFSENETVEKEVNDTSDLEEDENESVNEITGVSKGQLKKNIVKFHPYGLVRAIKAIKQNINYGNASNQSIRARTNVLKKFQARIQLLNCTNCTKQQMHERMRNRTRIYAANIADIAELTDNQTIKKELKNISSDLNFSSIGLIQAQKKIERRRFLVRLFVGGDRKAAKAIKQRTIHIQNKLQRLEQLKEKVPDNIRPLIEEHISALNEEVDRLEKLADKEEKSKGLLGWLFR